MQDIVKVCTWCCFGSLVFAVSWLLSFLLLIFLHVFVKGMKRVFTKCPKQPFFAIWKEYFRTLVEIYSPTITTWFVLHHVFHCCHGSASTYVPCGHNMHVAQHIHPEYHIQHFGGELHPPDSPPFDFLYESKFCKLVNTLFHCFRV